MLGPATPLGLITRWSPQPLALMAAVAAIGWYLWAARRVRRTGRRWPVGKTASFVAGIGLFVWTTCGFLQAYAQSLYWAWTTQTLVLLLAVPVLLLIGRPVELTRHALARPPASGSRRGVRGALGNPLLGPALVPIICAVLLFGPVPGWAARSDAVDWLVSLLVVALGVAVAAPLLNIGRIGSSLGVGLSAAILLVELLLDAIPGIVLRLHTTAASTYFVHRHLRAWSPVPLHDQQLGGAILWCVAESADLPLLVAIFVAWVHVDAREAREVDAVLAAERAMRGAGTDGPDRTEQPESAARQPGAGEAGASDPVWWLSDPALGERFRGSAPWPPTR